MVKYYYRVREVGKYTRLDEPCPFKYLVNGENDYDKKPMVGSWKCMCMCIYCMCSDENDKWVSCQLYTNKTRKEKLDKLLKING